MNEVNVAGKKFVVRELFAIEIDDINWDDKKSAIKQQVMISTGLTEEQYNKLTVRERLAIVQKINEINFLDFQTPTK